VQWQRLVLPSYRGDSRAVFVVGPVCGFETSNTVLRKGDRLTAFKNSFPREIRVFGGIREQMCQGTGGNCKRRI
jgi:hypothetical protein